MRHKLLLPLFVLFAAQTSHAEITVTFQHKFFTRKTPVFDQLDTSNVDDFVRGGNTGIVVGTVDKPEGWGLHVRITSGPNAGKTSWIYYSKNDPGMTLLKNGKGVDPTGKEIELKKKPVAVKRVYTPSADSTPDVAGNTTATGVCVDCLNTPEKESPTAALAKVSGSIDEMYPSAFKGALKTMAVIYQSCSVLDKAPYPLYSSRDKRSIDPYLHKAERFSSLGHRYSIRTIPKQNLSALVKTHYYLKDLTGPENSQCKDMRELPPLYTYGGKPKVTKTSIDLLVQQKTNGAGFSGLDCSTFVSTALTAAGLRIKPFQPIAENRATSTDLAKFTENNSCFANSAFSADSSIQPGDIIAYSGHTYMIDTVGKDPFGFEKMIAKGTRINTPSDCYRLPEDAERNFDFRLIQSAGSGSLAVSRTEASRYLSFGESDHYMRPHMISACLAKVTGKKVATTRNQGSTLLRHRGNEVAGCVIPKNQIPHMTGEECVASCTK